jgi:hypothetical protein
VRKAIKILFQGAWKTVLIAYAVLNIAGIPDNADALRDYLLPLGAYVGRIVGIAVLVAVLLSLVPAKARAWLWARRQGALPVAEVSTGVLADIEHREGCPRAPARMETYKTIRERDGIEITTGKCNDCGAMAYRHSADPVAPPVESVDHERRLTRANSVLPDRDPLQRKSGSKGSRESPLAAALVHERRNGRKWLSGLGVSAMASMFSPRTTEADVLGWEARVRYLLRDTPDLLVIFDYDSPEHSTPLEDVRYMTGVSAITGGKLAARLRRRLAQLDQIIEGL